MSTLNLGDSLIMNSDIVIGGGETKTGATFNGKPVYCKAGFVDNIVKTTDNMRDTWSVIIVENADVCLFVGGYWTNLDGDYYVGNRIAIGFSSMSSDKLSQYAGGYAINTTTHQISVNINVNASSWGCTKKSLTYYAFYTKTTD